VSDRKNANLKTPLCLKHAAEMMTFLAHSTRARGFGSRKAGYKTAADTVLWHHMKINLANRAVSI
jgi:hypothetical protein